MSGVFQFVLVNLCFSAFARGKSTNHRYSGVLVTNEEIKRIELKYESTLRVLELHITCLSQRTSYLSGTITDVETNYAILTNNVQCDGASERKISREPLVNGSFVLIIAGVQGTTYNLTLAETQIDLQISSEVVLSNKVLAVKALQVTEKQIETDKYAYMRITVDSPDITLSNNSDERNVAKVVVTKDYPTLVSFYENVELEQATPRILMVLSFSKFGAITLTNVTHPTLGAGTWYIGLLQTGTNIADKKVTITAEIVTNYSYTARILLLLMLSFTGVIFPLLSRIVFDYNNFRKAHKTRFKEWLEVLKGWFLFGNKGFPYLMLLIMVLLSVAAYQVVHAKWSDMILFGDRDMCYYNEKCYRPYGYYDVSVNNCASNLPFIVHGVILIIYFSCCEAYCKSAGHVYYNYSIPYAFGITFICEGVGSLLYHICPSQIIFQFDTMFMFMISILQLVGIFEGYSVRDSDIFYHHDTERLHKSPRPTKIFAFFVGPVYLFNFLGNISATSGLPGELDCVFYVVCGTWLGAMLGWVAYKIGLFHKNCDPENMPNLVSLEDSMLLKEIFSPTTLPSIKSRTRCIIKSIIFAFYATITVVGFILAVMGKVSFSIYLLGILTTAVLITTTISFIPLMHRLVMWVKENHNGYVVCGRIHIYGTNQIIIVCVMLGYVGIGCAFSLMSLVFFSYYEATDKSLDPWLSRELNDDCFIDNFYSAHDLWHLLASFSLMIMILVNVQIGKPCRDCYLSYLTKREQELVRKVTWKYVNGAHTSNDAGLLTIFRNHLTL